VLQLRGHYKTAVEVDNSKKERLQSTKITTDVVILMAASVYENDFPVSMMSCLKAEIFIWKKQWESETNLPESAVEALQHCTELLPNVKKLLQLFATLPVTSATPERTFSVLKRLITYLRATMAEER